LYSKILCHGVVLYNMLSWGHCTLQYCVMGSLYSTICCHGVIVLYNMLSCGHCTLQYAVLNCGPEL